MAGQQSVSPNKSEPEHKHLHEPSKRVCAVYKPKIKMHEPFKRVCAPQGKILAPVMHDEPTEEQLMHDSENVQETEKSAMPPAPYTPSQEERERHEISHWPYRAWCKFCIMGRGKNLDHARMDAELMQKLTRFRLISCIFDKTMNLRFWCCLRGSNGPC